MNEQKVTSLKINIKELSSVLAKHFDAGSCYIVSAKISSPTRKHIPDFYTLGEKGLLTIELEVTNE